MAFWQLQVQPCHSVHKVYMGVNRNHRAGSDCHICLRLEGLIRTKVCCACVGTWAVCREGAMQTTHQCHA